MNKHTLLALALICNAPAWAGDSVFAAPNTEETPAVVAAYEKQCSAWADEQKLSGTQRDDFVKNCVKEMATVWPVGYDESEG